MLGWREQLLAQNRADRAHSLFYCERHLFVPPPVVLDIFSRMSRHLSLLSSVHSSPAIHLLLLTRFWLAYLRQTLAHGQRIWCRPTAIVCNTTVLLPALFAFVILAALIRSIANNVNALLFG